MISVATHSKLSNSYTFKTHWKYWNCFSSMEEEIEVFKDWETWLSHMASEKRDQPCPLRTYLKLISCCCDSDTVKCPASRTAPYNHGITHWTSACLVSLAWTPYQNCSSRGSEMWFWNTAASQNSPQGLHSTSRVSALEMVFCFPLL